MALSHSLRQAVAALDEALMKVRWSIYRAPVLRGSMEEAWSDDHGELEAPERTRLAGVKIPTRPSVSGRPNLEPGKLADLAVLSQDVLDVPVEELPKTHSVLTMIEGEVVYRTADIAEAGAAE